MIVADPSPARPLANMSARPRTTVVRLVPVLRQPWIHFMAPLPAPVLDAEALGGLDAWWASTGLRGAILLHSVDRALAREVPLEPCQASDLTLNVLLRRRGSLLLADMPLVEAFDDETAGVASDDPRLVTLAGKAP